MSPRAGGEADKVGNRYEGAWAIWHALQCIAFDGDALTVEDLDPDLSAGSEFTYQERGRVHVHQVKRQNGTRNAWTVSSLARLGVFSAAATHVAARREYHFISMTAFGPLRELTERARLSGTLADFVQLSLNAELEAVLSELCAPGILGDPDLAWKTLRGMRFGLHDERELIRTNQVIAELALDGPSGHLSSLAIGDVLLDHLGQRMTGADLIESLAACGIAPRAVLSRTTITAAVAATTDRWRDSVRREQLKPVIPRPEAATLVEACRTIAMPLVVGAAGGGKSSVLAEAVDTLRDEGAHVLAVRLDRLESFTTSVDLGRQLGLDVSPAAALAVAAQGGRGYLVIDQLDAVSLASGRMPAAFDPVMDLIGEARSLSNVNVVIACREFDIKNDHRLRGLAADSSIVRVHVGDLTSDAVERAVADMGADPARLTDVQRVLLKSPLNLVLLSSAASQGDAVGFHSQGSLFEAFWTRKRLACRERREGVRFTEVISFVAKAASDRQTLSVPMELLDEDDLVNDADVLVSEHVLSSDGSRIAFFHESFFDYAFARRWVTRDESLVAFLTGAEQELFRRAQVRQILQHLRGGERARFLAEVEALLTSDAIRFHIKDAVVAVLAETSDPQTDEIDLLLRVNSNTPRLQGRVWEQVRTPAWFHRLHEDGVLARWLDGDSSVEHDRAIGMMLNAEGYENDVAAILQARQGLAEYCGWLRWITSFASLERSRALLDLVLPAVRDGMFDGFEHQLWLAARDLGKQQPTWGIELLGAHLVDRSNALARREDGTVAAVHDRDHQLSELVVDCASAEPRAFAERFIPYLQAVMSATTATTDAELPIRDAHFSYRLGGEFNHDVADLDDLLLEYCARALESLAGDDVAEIDPILRSLAGDPHDGAQYLLYRALAAAGGRHADWGAALLLEGGPRLQCGVSSDSVWMARVLLVACAPHVDDATHARLETLFVNLRNAYESPRSYGWTAFTFLSALEEGRLSHVGARRLGEYRRKFDLESPTPPTGITSGWVQSPIPESALSRMTDSQWLRAMATHDGVRERQRFLVGGAHELASSLKGEVSRNPVRFARLALGMPSDAHSAYANAILMGLGEAAVPESDVAVVLQAVRHIAQLGDPQNDGWLGWALQQIEAEVPLDMVALILDRALNSPDPHPDSDVEVVPAHGDSRRTPKDLYNVGINNARGRLAESLTRLLLSDSSGERSALIAPSLSQLARDPALSVRSCVAHTIAASLQFQRGAALAAFTELVDAHDALLASYWVTRLMLYIGNSNPELVLPVVRRMLASSETETREAGAQLATFAALEWSRPDLIEGALAAGDDARHGVATVCAARIAVTSNRALAAAVLVKLFNDPVHEVRGAAADVAMNLRGAALGPFAVLLTSLIDSPAFSDASPQLFITLEHAPDNVADLVVRAARRFLDAFGADVGDVRTGAAGGSNYIAELTVRGLAQASDPIHRSELLDILDRMIELGAYGTRSAIEDFERR